MNDVSVVVPSKNGHNFATCVEALRRTGFDGRVVLVDDGVEESWREYAERELPPIDVVRTGLPFVFARNVNAGIGASVGDDIVALNDDALVETVGGLDVLRRAADEHPEFGLIAASTNVTVQHAQRPQGKGLRSAPFVAFVCVYIPRRTIDRFGLLDERYRLDYGCEDRDYCESVARGGLKIGVHDGCFVDHSRLVSSFRGDPMTSRSYCQNLALFHEKWGQTGLMT